MYSFLQHCLNERFGAKSQVIGFISEDNKIIQDEGINTYHKDLTSKIGYGSSNESPTRAIYDGYIKFALYDFDKIRNVDFTFILRRKVVENVIRFVKDLPLIYQERTTFAMDVLHDPKGTKFKTYNEAFTDYKEVLTFLNRIKSQV